MQTAIQKTCKAGRKQSSFDRLAVTGGKVKIFRQNNSVEELRRGIKQLAALYAVGARFEEILIQVR